MSVRPGSRPCNTRVDGKYTCYHSDYGAAQFSYATNWVSMTEEEVSVLKLQGKMCLGHDF